MNRKTLPIAIIISAALSLVACQQQSKKQAEVQAPATTTQPAPETKPAPSVMSTKPELSENNTKQAQPAVPPVLSETTKPVAKPMAPSNTATTSGNTVPETASTKPGPAPMTIAFSTTKCQACHAIDHDKVGPAWKTVVAAYGSEAALAKAFESGFDIKSRKIASAEPKWASKAALMTMQYKNLIKGHGKEAAHALFMTVKDGKFGSY